MLLEVLLLFIVHDEIFKINVCADDCICGILLCFVPRIKLKAFIYKATLHIAWIALILWPILISLVLMIQNIEVKL